MNTTPSPAISPCRRLGRHHRRRRPRPGRCGQRGHHRRRRRRTSSRPRRQGPPGPRRHAGLALAPRRLPPRGPAAGLHPLITPDRKPSPRPRGGFLHVWRYPPIGGHGIQPVQPPIARQTSPTRCERVISTPERPAREPKTPPPQENSEMTTTITAASPATSPCPPSRQASSALRALGLAGMANAGTYSYEPTPRPGIVATPNTIARPPVVVMPGHRWHHHHGLVIDLRPANNQTTSTEALPGRRIRGGPRHVTRAGCRCPYSDSGRGPK